MAPMFALWINRDDYDRLYALKEEDGKEDLTGNEYAQELLKEIIHKRHPERVQFNEETGERIKRK